MTKERNKNIFVKLLKILLYTVISFVCIITILLIVYIVNAQIHSKDENYRPKVSIYTIVSPSMTPYINVYDVVLNVRADKPENIHVGDVITYKSTAANSEGMTITHRVISADQLPDGTYEYKTQGDNNSEPDSVYVTFDNVIGKEVLVIPKLGKIQFFLANQRGWLILLIIPIIIYLFYEIIKLTDLYGLRKKVDRVVGITEESEADKEKRQRELLAEKERQAILEAQRKEALKEAIIAKEVKKEAIIKSDKEVKGFFEPIVETDVVVDNNKYKNILEVVEKEENPQPVEQPETTKIGKVPKKEPEPEIILPTKVMNDQYEILDTDELSSKIKEYDTKISKLDKMIKDMEEIKDKKVDEPELIEVDNYLQGNKIKVTKIEETKNKKIIPQPRKKTTDVQPEQDVKIELTSIIPIQENKRTKIKRPNSVDIKELRKDINKKDSEEPKKATKRKLNLDPTEVKKVNRTRKTTAKKEETTKKKLNLDPKEVKKINRPGKSTTKKTTTTKKTITKKTTTTKKVKGPLIRIEKVR